MTPDVETSTLRAQQLINLTQALTQRLSAESAAFRAHRAQDVAAGMAETQELANLYRRESAQAKAADTALWDGLRNIAKAMKAASAKLGTPVIWGGDWKSFPDGPHFELKRK